MAGCQIFLKVAVIVETLAGGTAQKKNKHQRFYPAADERRFHKSDSQCIAVFFDFSKALGRLMKYFHYKLMRMHGIPELPLGQQELFMKSYHSVGARTAHQWLLAS